MPAIYTRSGDKGSTGLFGGTRVLKQEISVEAYGTVDEANSAIGAAKLVVSEEYRKVLNSIQSQLFILASELASDANGKSRLTGKISDADITALEKLIDESVAITGPTTRFVIPGRDAGSAALHQARTIVRRAEREVLRMAETHEVRDELIRYLNRLSDALYAVARVHEEKADLMGLEAIVREAIATVMNRNASAVLDLSLSKALSQAAEEKAAELGVPIVFAAVDAGGNLILVHRMEDSLLASIDIAINKAYTSTAMRQPTADLRDVAGVDGPLYSIENSSGGRLVLFGGGVPVFCEGRISGGIGVSGGTVEEDIIIVTHAFDKVVRS